MRPLHSCLLILPLVVAAARVSRAQGGAGGTEPSSRALPREVQREVVERWNEAKAVRQSGPFDVAPGQVIRGDVAVAHGPLTIAGHVEGSVLAVNADVLLRPDARIDGDLLMVGGDLEGRDLAHVSGPIRIYHQSLAYREDGTRIVVTEDATGSSESWLHRLERGREGNWSEALRVVQAGPYNRVEGLPIQLGPAVHRRSSWGGFSAEAAAVLRTATTFSSDGGDAGYRLRSEVRFGHERDIGVGAQALSVIDPTERWELSDLEVALASFVARRDYRDYFVRHGGSAFITLYGARDLSLTGSFGEERWSSRPSRNPFTLFDGDRAWRPNPMVDEGLFHVGTLALKFDTRTDPDDPWSGWFANADIEHGRGAISSPASVSFARAVPTGDITDYTRAFVDVRRYNRLGPSAQLNVRLVGGGRIGGDELPLERRLSVDGPGTLPGFDFRSARAGTDVSTCDANTAALIRPAECERIVLAQVELRNDIGFDFTGNWQDWPRHYHTAHGDAMWVLFADFGRGWLVGPSDGALTFGSGTLPPLSSFRSDVGLGIDIGGIGVYMAKSVSASAEPLNFFFRLRHRF